MSGIIHSALQLKSGSDESFVLSFDGKKLAPGLNAEFGDQDLFGHEPASSNPDYLQDKVKMETEAITNFIDQIDSM